MSAFGTTDEGALSCVFQTGQLFVWLIRFSTRRLPSRQIETRVHSKPPGRAGDQPFTINTEQVAA